MIYCNVFNTVKRFWLKDIDIFFPQHGLVDILPNVESLPHEEWYGFGND